MNYSYEDDILTCDCCSAKVKVFAKLQHKETCTEFKGGFASLTSREKEMLYMIAEANTAKDIATKLNIAIKTVDKHRDNMFQKMGVHSKIELISKVYALGILTAKQVATV